MRLNAAIVTAYAVDAAAGLAELDALEGEKKLVRYAPYHAARGELLVKLGRTAEAAVALRTALDCPLNGAEREYLTKKLQGCLAGSASAYYSRLARRSTL